MRALLYSGERRIMHSFDTPRELICARCIGEILPALGRIEALVETHGLHAVGFLSYEAAPAFDRALQVQDPRADLPLLCFGLFDSYAEVPVETITAPPADPLQWESTVSRDTYDQAVAQIQRFISRGRTYQVNFTYRMRAPFAGDPQNLFGNLFAAQPVACAAFIETDTLALCSISPELFFTLRRDRIVSRPMKGTAPRGMTLEEDRKTWETLRHSAKDRAENVMIVDMIRNDLGRIAHPGSVATERLFHLEKYPSVWQMTSDVAATTGASVRDILGALFPCASITGAPKVESMKIIRELESTPRGVYTGTIGRISPGRDAAFSVAIRTVTVYKQEGIAEYGTGGGIVADSRMDSEFRETETKAQVLMERSPSFELLETLLWHPDDGFFLLEYHLNRIASSAAYFDRPFCEEAARALLTKRAERFADAPTRVRLLLSPSGRVRVESAPLGKSPETGPLKLGLAETPVHSRNRFLYHKTTNRTVYEKARESRPGCDDAILWNERREVTESTIGNLVFRLGEELVTPPVSSGLLAGVFRRQLLETGQIRERVVGVDELHRCENIYRINSVRRWEGAEISRP